MFSLILTLNFTVTLLLTATLKYLEYHQINLLKWYLLGSFLALAAYHLHCSLKYYNKKLICNFQLMCYDKQLQELRRKEGRSDNGRHRTLPLALCVYQEAEPSVKKEKSKINRILTQGKVCKDDFCHTYAKEAQK